MKNDKFLAFDLEKKSSILKIKKIISKKIDTVINNVGGTLNINDPLTSYEDYERVFYLNIGVAVEINNLVVPKMKRKKFGRIVHISSISSLENQGPPTYCSSKAALNAYVRSVGRYLSSFNIIMTTVLPGAVFTKDGYWDKKSKNNPDFVKKYLNERMASKRFGDCKN